MKRMSNLVVLLAVASLALSACGPAFAPGGSKYQQGLWVKFELAEPIRLNQPVTVTITVETEKDEVGLQINMTALPPDIVLVEGERHWVVNTRAGQPIQVTSTVRFIREGWCSVHGGAVARGGGSVTGGVYVHVTQAGGTVNPTHTLPAGPAPAAPVGTPSLPTPAPPPSTPASRNTYVPPLPPAEVLARCGWAPGQPQPTPWQHARAWVNVPESVSPNTPIPVTLGVGLPCAATAAVRLKLALCRPDPAVQVVGAREWTVEARPGVSTIVSTTLRFTREGEFELIAGAYDSATGRVISGGYRVLVSQGQTKTQTGWVNIVEEGFEGDFPGPGWTRVDRSSDGYDRRWGQNDYRAYQSSWAAWPACGGSNAICPEAPYGPEDYYPNNMDTWMIYGPFDLRDAVLAHTDFQLWRKIRSGDYLVFEVSHDGVAFQELARWDGSGDGWELKDVYYNDYRGDDSVWVAWRFYSNGSSTWDGPWVDRVRVWKYVPGQVTACGHFYYPDRDGQVWPAPHTRVRLYDADPGGTDDLLGEATANADGFWQIGPLRNWDDDDSSTNPSERRLDLYAVFQTDVYDRAWGRWRTINYVGTPYGWWIPPGYYQYNVGDGTADLGAWMVPSDAADRPAMWLFQDFRRAWEYVWNQTGTDPGPASVKWQPAGTGAPPYPSTTCYWYGPPVEGVLIMYPHEYHSDVVIHELGHGYMYNAWNDWFWWTSLPEYLTTCRDIHEIHMRTGDTCAWTEGWADFLAVAVNGDPELDWPNGSIGNLETATSIRYPNWAQGDECEGRVAAALYDLFDSNNDGLDHVSFGFRPIWNVLRIEPRQQSCFREFWRIWMESGQSGAAGYTNHDALLALLQNTINYNQAPRIDLPNTTITVLQGYTLDNAIDLWACSSDEERPVSELTWQIIGGASSPCGPRLDGHFVDFVPTPGWTGFDFVTIQVSDGISTTWDRVVVQVNPIRGRVYLPLALKGYGGTRGASVPLPATTPTPGGYPAPAAPLTLPSPTTTPRGYPAP